MTYDLNLFKTRTREVGEWLAKELATIRTGRATPALLDGVSVEIYGARTPLKHLASISVSDPRTLQITLWDKGQQKAVETAISQANLGVSLRSDSSALQVIFPELTAEKRQLLGKLAQEKLEQARISLRQERERVWHEVQTKEREGALSEDEKFRAKDQLQKLVDETNQALEAQIKRKAAEINQ